MYQTIKEILTSRIKTQLFSILYHYLHHKLYFRKKLDFRITCFRNYTLVASITIS